MQMQLVRNCATSRLTLELQLATLALTTRVSISRLVSAAAGELFSLFFPVNSGYEMNLSLWRME